MRQFLQSAVRLLVVGFIGSSVWAATIVPTGRAVPGEVLVRIQTGVSQDAIARLGALADADRTERIASLSSGTLWRMHSRSKNVEALTSALEGNANVVYVEPNYILSLDAVPNDPSYGELWGLKNTGQIFSGSTGLPGVDIDAEEAWNVTTGSSAVVVGVIDTGVDYNHPDLAANIWSNPGGKGNAACAAGTHGFNAITRTCDPMDNHSHGTHVSGTIGAVGNNALGVTGVNWTTSIMGLKFLDQYGYGTIADAIAAIEFAVQAKIDGVNIRVLSNSWGGFSFSRALLDAINRANGHDILFVTSAGNDSSNNDSFPHYPSNYATPNMIAVAALDSRDEKAWFSNWGLTTVHLGAPGVNILSTYPGNGYDLNSGTSMAAPHVAGVAALVLAATPGLTTAQVKSAILDNTDPVFSLSGRTVTGGRLNAARALGIPAGPDFSLSTSPSSRTVVRGASTSFVITVNPSAGFAGSVDLAVASLPSGITASFSPDSTTTTSTLTVTTSQAMLVGGYGLTITGVSGALTHAISVVVNVTPAPPPSACPALTQFTSANLTVPTSVTVGDFNRDGLSDLAVTQVSLNRISIRHGAGNGIFAAGPSYAVGSAPLASATADFNRDGKPDLAVANSGSNNISILLGNGDGTFQAAVPHAAGTSPFSLATGDFNGDGKSDLAVADNGSNDVSILLGLGDGTFQAAVQYGAGTGPFGVAVGDVNGDGRADLAVASHHSDQVSVLLGNGDGTFAASVPYDAGDAPSSVAFSDFNGDGNADLAVTNYGSDNVSVLLGIGDGTFQAAAHSAVGLGPYSVSVGDFNGDAVSDLVVANGDNDSVSVLMGSGNGGFQAALTLNVGDEPNQASVGDFNGDGKADLAVVNAGNNLLLILLNTGICSLNCGSMAAPVPHAVSGPPHALATADFNGDGKPDLAATVQTTNSVSLALGNGDGTFYAGVSAGVGTDPDAVTAGDFNGDGRIDLATANNGSDNASILLGNGDGTFSSAVDYAAGTDPRSIAAADFNRDGRLDLVTANGGSNNVSLLLGNGNGTFQSAMHSGAGTNPSSVTSGDFNRDGKADLAVANEGSANVSILLGNGDGTFQTATQFAVGTSPRSIVAADLNRDGKPDLAVANSGSNNASVLLGDGNGAFAAAVHYGAGTNPYSIVAADLNDDGKRDLGVANHGSNNVSVLLGIGAGAFAPAVANAGGSSPEGMVAADLNRDGKTDLAVADSGSGSVNSLRNICPLPDLTVTKTHAGTFSQGEVGKSYTITVTNSGLTPTNDLVSATDTLPAGLNATAMSGTGWLCTLNTLTCTRSDVLAAGASYPPITFTVNVASSAASSVTNTVKVSGGGELNVLNNTATDPTTITQITDLVVTSTHSGSFTQGVTGKTYSIVARNAGGLPTSGLVTVSDTLPSGLTATAMSGPGWSCNLLALTCTRSNALAGGTSYPAITLTVDVATDAPSLVTNTATVSGGGQTNTANDTATDPTVVWSTETCGGFGTPTNYGNGNTDPSAVAIGHFNGDDAADLAVANQYSNNVSILLGNGDGTFQSAVNFAAGPYPHAIAVGDLDNDGHDDLVIANYYDSISVLLGSGTGAFAAPVSYVVGQNPFAIAIGDFDSDGNRDVAVTNNYSGSVSILLGSGNGSLQPAVHYPVNQATGIVVTDLDGNGISDLAVTTSYNGLRILLGNGDGTFQPASADTETYNSTSVAAGDFNQDGKNDLAVSTYYDGVRIRLGNGDGTIQAGVPFSTPYGSRNVLPDDINGDGIVDLIVGSSDYVSTLAGNGDGTFQTAAHHHAGYGLTSTALGDFNADGKPDLALIRYYNSQTSVMLGGCADLTITKTHDGNFGAGQQGVYTLTVTNTGDGSTSSTVTVTDVLPDGLTASYIYGGWPWYCQTATLTCTRDGSLAPGESWEPIYVYVDVDGDAPANVINVANVSGGGDNNPANNSASDPTTIGQIVDLTVTKTHEGLFVQGQTGRTYTITVSNIGSVPTQGTVSVTDYLPYGLGITEMTGPGWTCDVGSRTCTRQDALGGNSSYPPITLTVMVYNYAPINVTNQAYVSGGGDTFYDNNWATDFTSILATPTNLTATAISTSHVELTWNYVSYATSYEIHRSANNGPFVLLESSLTNAFFDATVSPNTTYLYRVRAVSGGVISASSTVDAATTVIFIEDPIVSGVTKVNTLHITQLRQAVNSVRAAAGLPPTVWTDPTLPSGTFIKAIHLTQLRTSLDQARSALGLFPVGYGEATITPGSTIKAAHIRELRSGVR